MPQLKEELAARASTRAGMKAVLQRRLHGMLIEAAIKQFAEDAEMDGGEARVDPEDADVEFWEELEKAQAARQAREARERVEAEARARRRKASRADRMYELFGTDSEGSASEGFGG